MKAIIVEQCYKQNLNLLLRKVQLNPVKNWLQYSHVIALLPAICFVCCNAQTPLAAPQFVTMSQYAVTVASTDQSTARQRRFFCVAAFTLSCIVATPQTSSHRQLPSKASGNRQQIMLEWPIKTTPYLLDLRQEPSSATDRSHEMFFDQGAWLGYALPPGSDTGTGSVGPFLSASGPGRWVGARFATAQLADAITGKPIRLSACDHGGTGIVLTETLFYATASTALVRVTVKATHTMAVQLSLGGTQSA